jgi:transcriptional regulator of acetoin/glycerol metabolism
VLQAELFSAESARPPGDMPSAPLGDWLAIQEREYILRALESQAWRVQDTATLLGISRKNLWEKMKRLAVQRPNIPLDETD